MNHLICKGWHQEGIMRLWMNSVDPELVGEGHLNEREWTAFQRVVSALKSLNNDETLLIQSGHLVGVFKTHPMAPRVCIAHANLVPAWANDEQLKFLASRGVILRYHENGGGWVNVGSQLAINETYTVFSEVARKSFGSADLTGKSVLTSGLGHTGSAQPIAGKMLNAVTVTVEIDSRKLDESERQGGCDVVTNNLDEVIRLAEDCKEQRQSMAIGVHGNCVDVYQQLLARGFVPDIVTDQTHLHQLEKTYVPKGLSLLDAAEMKKHKLEQFKQTAIQSVEDHVDTLISFQQKGSVAFEYGNGLAQHGKKMRQIVRLAPAYMRRLLCEGNGQLYWVALSGDAGDIETLDNVLIDLFSANESLVNWIASVKALGHSPGLPYRSCWLELNEQKEFALRVNKMIADGDLIGPIAFGRDIYGNGSVASPNRETASMKDGSDVVADWPILTALLNTCSGASWVSVQHGLEAGMGRSTHTSHGLIVDGTTEANTRIEHLFVSDLGLGIVRYADAGYEQAAHTVKKHEFVMPMLG